MSFMPEKATTLGGILQPRTFITFNINPLTSHTTLLGLSDFREHVRRLR